MKIVLVVLSENNRNPEIANTFWTEYIKPPFILVLIAYSQPFLDREKAIEMCRQLVERNFGHGVEKGKETEFKDDDSVYRLLEDDESTALNSGMSSVCEPRPAPEVAEELRRLILTLYSKFLSKDGRVSVIVFFMSQLALL